MNVITNDKIRSFVALSALYNVIDPEIGLNIVDLGLIYQIDFDHIKSTMLLSMTLTTQFCPMGESIKEGAASALRKAFPDLSIHVDLVFDPPWTAEHISEEGKAFLNR